MVKFFTFLVLLISSTQVSAQRGDTLYYDRQPELTWEDFEKVPGFANDSSTAFLSVTIQLRLLKANIWMGYGIYDAHAVAYRRSSWVKDGAQSISALRHQQYAFNLAELVASMLKQEINEAKINLRWEKKIHKVFAKYNDFVIQCLSVYRKETENGRNKLQQAEWEALIDRKQVKLAKPEK